MYNAQNVPYLQIFMNILRLTAVLILIITKAVIAQSDEGFNRIINSKFNDKNPTISQDGKMLIFCSERNHSFGGVLKLYQSQKNEDGNWTEPSPLQILNDTLEDSFKTIHTCISADKQVLYVSGRLKGRKSRDIAFAKWADSTWTNVALLPNNINSDMEETSPTLSLDGNTLYFIRFKENINEEYKQYDCGQIYVTHKQKDQSWSEPELLPTNINASCNHSVYLLADAKTIIFTAEKAGGKGGLDFYQSERLKNGSWTNPVNLYAFNSLFHDSAISTTNDKKWTYISNDKPKNSLAANYNVYQIPFNLSNRSPKEVLVKGTVYESQTIKPLQTQLKITLPLKDSTIIVMNTDEAGAYQIALKDSELYFFLVELEGYADYKSYFDLSNLEGLEQVILDIELMPKSKLFSTNEEIVLENITFAYNSAVLNPLALTALENVVDYLLDYPKSKLEISAHTDNEGTSEQNLILSNQRAKAVVDFFIKKGISAQRLSPKGYGDTQPLAENNSESNKSLNRRVEFRVLK